MRPKSAKHCKILPWLSARTDNTEGRFIQVGNSLLLSHRDNDTGKETNNFIKLSSGAKLLYLAMALESGGRKQYEFPLKAAHKYGIPSTSLRRGVRELKEAGFIRYQSGKTARLPNLYEFCLDWKMPS